MEDTPTPSPVPRPRSTVAPKLVGALIGAVAALSIGGVGFAFAQESEAPTTTEAPTTDTTPHGDEDCPEKDGPGATSGEV